MATLPLKPLHIPTIECVIISIGVVANKAMKAVRGINFLIDLFYESRELSSTWNTEEAWKAVGLHIIAVIMMV